MKSPSIGELWKLFDPSGMRQVFWDGYVVQTSATWLKVLDVANCDLVTIRRSELFWCKVV